jgi:signal transduction histidine kinase
MSGNPRTRAVAFLRRRGIRARSVAVAVAVVLVALLLGGGGLVYLLKTNLDATARQAAQTRAGEVASIVATQGVDVASTAIQQESRSGQLVQILSSDGQVLGASSKIADAEPMSPQRPAPGETEMAAEDIDHVGEGGTWIVVSTGVIAPTGRPTVVQVGVPTQVQQQTVQIVAVFLLTMTPVLVVGAGVAVWLLVGLALRSVEHIRAEVATIDEQRLGRRLAVPPTRDEIAALATTMNTMLDRLETSQRVQRAFVSDASHELRSPLATLTTATELATVGDEAARTRLLGTISVELRRVQTLVDNLMTLARADAHDLLAVDEDVDLDDLVDAEVRRLRATSNRAVSARLQPVRLSGDGQRLAQALRNLVDNAERHAASAVRLSLWATSTEAVVDVDNDGQLIRPEDRERVFERFVRLDESRSRDAGGSGLGLAIARTAVESHGGSLRVTDSPDGWCRFEIRIPVPPSSPFGAAPAEEGSEAEER